MTIQTLNNGETGLSFRTKLNDNFTNLANTKIPILENTSTAVDIQNAMNTASTNGGDFVFIKAGTYILTSKITPKDNVTVIGIGTVIFTTTSLAGELIEGLYTGGIITNSGFKNIIFDCNNQTNLKAITCQWVDGFTLENCELKNVNAVVNGIEVGYKNVLEDGSVHKSYNFTCKNIKITNCHVGSKEHILWTNIEGYHIEGLDIDTASTGAGVFSPFVFSTNGVLRDLHYKTGQATYLIDINHNKDVLIENCSQTTTNGTTKQAVFVRNCQNLTFNKFTATNTFTTGATSAGITVQDWRDTVDDHTVEWQSDNIKFIDVSISNYGSGITLERDSSDANKAIAMDKVKFRDCDIYNFKGYGIKVGNTAKTSSICESWNISSNTLETTHNCTAGIGGEGQNSAELKRFIINHNNIKLWGNGDFFEFDYLEDSDIIDNKMERVGSGTGSNYNISNGTNNRTGVTTVT